MKQTSVTSITLMVAVVLLSRRAISHVEGQLQVGFYKRTCRSAESIVRDEVVKAYLRSKGVPAGLVRMHFHSSFVRGCDGSVLIDSTPSNTAEKDKPVVPGLWGLEVIDSAKARVEAVCKGIVSCDDILAFAAGDSVHISGGLNYDIPAGRRDGRVSLDSEVIGNLPPPFFNLTQLTQNFASKGFTQDEMIILSGAHTIGRSHCISFTNRLYNFCATASQDPSLDPTYAAQLKQLCLHGSTNPNLVVPMDTNSPNDFNDDYYEAILANRRLFTSHQMLLSSPQSASLVMRYANNSLEWKNKFSAVMVKMYQLDVLTRTASEIRASSRVVN